MRRGFSDFVGDVFGGDRQQSLRTGPITLNDIPRSLSIGDPDGTWVEDVMVIADRYARNPNAYRDDLGIRVAQALSSNATRSRSATQVAGSSRNPITNYMSDYRYEVGRSLQSFSAADRFMSRPVRPGDGIGANLQALGGLAQLAGATLQYVGSPITAAFDTVVGRPAETLLADGPRGTLLGAPYSTRLDRYAVGDIALTTATAAMTGPIGLGRSGSIRATGVGPSTTEGASARHVAWSSDLGAINDTTAVLGQRALRNSGGDWAKSEALFNRYLSLADARLARTGSVYSVELQPAAIAGGERVPSFIWMHRGDATSPLIMASNGAPHLFAYPGSRRLDAGIIDMTAAANQYGLRPVVSGYDITLNATKPPVGGYYREYFGNIPITDIRLRAGN